MRQTESREPSPRVRGGSLPTLSQGERELEIGRWMDVDRAIRERRTIGVFSERAVAQDVIEDLIEAARWAPNHKHTEPWRFHVVSGSARAEMCEAVLAGGGEFAKDPRGKLMRSPMFIAVTQQAVPDDPVRDREDYAAVCCAVQNMMLAATARGLASKWSTGALAENAAAKRWLGIGDRDRIVAYLYLGYAPEEMREMPAERRPAEVVWRG